MSIDHAPWPLALLERSDVPKRARSGARLRSAAVNRRSVRSAPSCGETRRSTRHAARVTDGQARDCRAGRIPRGRTVAPGVVENEHVPLAEKVAKRVRVTRWAEQGDTHGHPADEPPLSRHESQQRPAPRARSRRYVAPRHAGAWLVAQSFCKGLDRAGGRQQHATAGRARGIGQRLGWMRGEPPHRGNDEMRGAERVTLEGDVEVALAQEGAHAPERKRGAGTGTKGGASR